MLSLPKILLLVIVGFAIWHGWRWWQRKQAADAVSARSPASARAAEDLVKCPKCGTYVAAGSPHQCTAG